jgi:ABC-type nitrate/sulfonate/bicarbonate transport system substrate-binding protein
MRLIATLLATCILISTGNLGAEPVRAAYPSANVQFLPAFVALEKGFYKREGLDAELVSVRNAVTAVQALLGNQIHFIFSVGPQMPSIWEGSDIILLAQQVGRPTFSMIVTPDIQRVSDLKGKKIGVSFGGSTFAGTKALLELNKISDKDVQYISIPGSTPKIAAMQQGIIQAALLAPPPTTSQSMPALGGWSTWRTFSKTHHSAVLPPREKPSKSSRNSSNVWCARWSAALFIPVTIPKTRFKSWSGIGAWSATWLWMLTNWSASR